MSSSAFTGSPLRSLSEASIPAIAFSRHCSSRKISTPNCRDKSSTGSPRKSRRATSRLRVTVHRWPSPSGSAGETWPGENVDEPSSPSFTTGPSTPTLFSKLSVMFRSSLDTSIKPILCPRKSGPTHRELFAPLPRRRAEIFGSIPRQVGHPDAACGSARRGRTGRRNRGHRVRAGNHASPSDTGDGSNQRNCGAGRVRQDDRDPLGDVRGTGCRGAG